MKMLEPEACSKVRVVMSDDVCYQPFIEAIANYLKPEILTTLPLHVSFVDKYNKIVQSSLGPHTQRLDELIYALFKMNELIQCKIDRIRLGLNGSIKSIPQLNFEQVILSLFNQRFEKIVSYCIYNLKSKKKKYTFYFSRAILAQKNGMLIKW